MTAIAYELFQMPDGVAAAAPRQMSETAAEWPRLDPCCPHAAAAHCSMNIGVYVAKVVMVTDTRGTDGAAPPDQ